MSYLSKRIFLTFLIFLGINISFIYAQVLQRDTIRPPRKEVEIIRFDDDSYRGKSNKKPKAPRHIIKTAPFAFIMGYMPVFYEYRMKDWLTLQAGVGVNFKPVTYDVMDLVAAESCTDDVCPNYYDFSIRKIKTGALLSVAPRLYFGSDAPEGGYVSPEFRVYARRSDATNVNSGLPGVETIDKEHYRVQDFMVHYGYQTLYPKLTVDWSVGVGLRTVSGVFQKEFYELYYYSESVKQSVGPFFRASVGLRIGFQL